MRDNVLLLIFLQVVSALGAGFFLYASRFYTIALVPAVLLLSLAIILAFYSRYRLFSLLVITALTSLCLSLRFDFLPWGDPWYDFGMISRILSLQSLNPPFYTDHFPVLHVLIAACSLVSTLDPMLLQKFIIPAVSVIGVYAIYKITEDISSSDTAFYSGLLLLAGTPYLHWITQSVRETLGLALFLLILYVCIHSIRFEKKRYALVALLLISGVVLTHHLTMGVFLFVWLAVSIVFVYIVCDFEKIRKTALLSLVITIASAVIMVGWWGSKGGFEFFQLNEFLNRLFFCQYGIPLFFGSVITLYLIPMFAPKQIQSLRSFVQYSLGKKDMIYGFFVIMGIISGIFVLSIILGKSVFFLSYPLSMLFNGICIVGLSLIGLYYLLDKDRLPIFAWIAILSLALVLSLSNVIQIEDRIRIIEFLYMPLSIVAALGLSRISTTHGYPRVFPILITIFVVISIITAFPSIVFFGNTFEPGHPLYDNRSLVIQHDPTEIHAITWLATTNVPGVIESDAYVGYAVRGMILKDSLSIESGYPFMRAEGYSQHTDSHTQPHYLLILSRMKKYTEFGIQWLQKKEPLNNEDLQKIDNGCNLLYTNGDAQVFSYSSNVSSYIYYYNLRSK